MADNSEPYGNTSTAEGNTVYSRRLLIAYPELHYVQMYVVFFPLKTAQKLELTII
jgi:hypothetical protein